MAYQSNSHNVLLGRGRLFFDRWSSSNVDTNGLAYLGDCSKLEISTSDEKASIYDYGQSTAPLLNEVVTKREVTVSMTLHEYTKENLALVLMGVEAGATQSSGSITGETLTTSVTKGKSYQTANRSISSVVVKKGASTLVLDTDYNIVDATLGIIHITTTGSTLTNGDTITVDYAKAAIASPGLDRVQGGMSSQILGRLVFIGDAAAGPSFDAEFWKVSISSDGVAGFITGSDFGSFDLKGTVLIDSTNHPTEAYYRMTKRS